MSRGIKRTYQTLSAKEEKKYGDLHGKFNADKPEFVAWARAWFVRDQNLRNICPLLRAARRAKGLRLADVDQASGIDKVNLPRLENHSDANPTPGTQNCCAMLRQSGWNFSSMCTTSQRRRRNVDIDALRARLWLRIRVTVAHPAVSVS